MSLDELAMAEGATSLEAENCPANLFAVEPCQNTPSEV